MITSLNIIAGSHQSYWSTHGPASHVLGATRPRQYRRGHSGLPRDWNRSSGAETLNPDMIALGMGLHNLCEGLAIGASYATGAWVLSWVLVSGFALHNSTEGFAIIGAMGKSEPRFQDVVLMGFLAGAPTCLGTVISAFAVSSYLSIIFYALAAGSLLYVIFSLVTTFYTATRRMQTATGVFTGVSLMYLTAMVLTILTGTHT